MKLGWVILVPTLTPEGKGIHTRFHKVWDAKVTAIAGGLTIHHPVKGYWKSEEGQLFVERMIPVEIDCTREQIAEIALMTGRYYRQQAIRYTLASSDVTILTIPAEKPKPKKEPRHGRQSHHLKASRPPKAQG